MVSSAAMHPSQDLVAWRLDEGRVRSTNAKAECGYARNCDDQSCTRGSSGNCKCCSSNPPCDGCNVKPTGRCTNPMFPYPSEMGETNRCYSSKAYARGEYPVEHKNSPTPNLPQGSYDGHSGYPFTFDFSPTYDYCFTWCCTDDSCYTTSLPACAPNYCDVRSHCKDVAYPFPSLTSPSICHQTARGAMCGWRLPLGDPALESIDNRYHADRSCADQCQQDGPFENSRNGNCDDGGLVSDPGANHSDFVYIPDLLHKEGGYKGHNTQAPWAYYHNQCALGADCTDCGRREYVAAGFDMKFIVDNCLELNVLDTMVRCASDALDAPRWGPTPEQCSTNPTDKDDNCKSKMLEDWNHLGGWHDSDALFPTEWKCSDNWAKTNCLKTCCEFKAQLKSPSECEGAKDTWDSEDWINGRSADACRQWSENNDWGAWSNWRTLSQACDSDAGGWGMRNCKRTCCDHKKRLDLLHEPKLACPARNPGWLSLPLVNTSFSPTKDCYEGLVDESSLHAALNALQSHGSTCNAITLSQNRYHGRIVDERCKFCVSCCSNETSVGQTSWVLISKVSLPPPAPPVRAPQIPKLSDLYPQFNAKQASLADFLTTGHVKVSFLKTLKVCARQFKVAVSANLGMVAADEVFQKAHNLLRSTEFTRSACDEDKCPKSFSDLGKDILKKGVMGCALSGVLAQVQSPELNDILKKFPALKELKENLDDLADCFRGAGGGECKMIIGTTPINGIVRKKIEGMCDKFSEKIADVLISGDEDEDMAKDIEAAEAKFCNYLLMNTYNHWSGRDKITCERVMKECKEEREDKCNPEDDPGCEDDDGDDTGDDPAESDPDANVDPDPDTDASSVFDDVIDEDIAEVLEESVAETVDDVIATAVDATIMESTSAAASAAVEAAEAAALSSEAVEVGIAGTVGGFEGAELVTDVLLGLLI
eukprot:CAMPEP_0115882544 /NCGR_PEP_ID=MMETSP0287-20121206/29061_1 /TAXON_ID=412157 /ORGANISM="Chrysochromulina rotalis, Strain UIO044" /LENGTH=933 /DNA_ID=CAMNT_0003338629 /DNA_START=1 /DNA_END=2802 /DNA_ORIENTATION=+